MKNKFGKYIIVGAIAIVASFTILGSYRIDKNTPNTAIFSWENIEALAQTEQPDIKDCISSTEWDCIALHPTNPNLDKVKKDAMWPN